MSELDFNSSKAIYKQLMEIFTDKINAGEWPAKSRILSEKEICEKYGVSRITVRKTIDELVKAGYVEKVQGKGTFVKEKVFEQKLNRLYTFRDELSKKGVETAVEMKTFIVISAEEDLASKLEIETGKEVFLIERLFKSKERPYAKEISYIPRALCHDLRKEQVLKNGLYKSLNSFGIYPDKAVENLKIASMTKKISEEMSRKKGEAYVEFNRITYCNDVVVEYATSNVCGDMFFYTVELNGR